MYFINKLHENKDIVLNHLWYGSGNKQARKTLIALTYLPMVVVVTVRKYYLSE